MKITKNTNTFIFVNSSSASDTVLELTTEEDMIGFKTLAVPGPTNMLFEIRQAMDVALEDHRAPDFPEFTKPLLEDVKSIFRTTNGRVFLFPGSGTGG